MTEPDTALQSGIFLFRKPRIRTPSCFTALPARDRGIRISHLQPRSLPHPQVGLPRAGAARGLPLGATRSQRCTRSIMPEVHGVLSTIRVGRQGDRGYLEQGTYRL